MKSLKMAKKWNLEQAYRLQKESIPRKNINEPVAYCPERIPLALKAENIERFSIDAEIVGDHDVAKCSSICFVIPTFDDTNITGGNGVVAQNNWAVLTQNWKEGSIAQVTLYSNQKVNILDVNFDLWIFVNGLNESIDLKITVSPIGSGAFPQTLEIQFVGENAPLVPTHTGEAFNNRIVNRNQALGAYTGSGKQASLHPKQIFTSNLLQPIVDRIAESKGEKITVAYIGLDTGENFFSVNRALRGLSNIKEVCLVHHHEWDDRYMPLLRPLMDEHLKNEAFEITYISTNELEDSNPHEDIDIIVSTSRDFLEWK